MADMVSITLDDAPIRALFNRLHVFTGGRAREPMGEVARYIVTSIQLRFDRQEGPEGERWKPSIRVVKHGGQTLRDHGHFRNSWQREITDHSAGATTNIPYAAPNQFGVNRVVSVRAHRRMSRGGGDKRRGVVSVKSFEVRSHQVHMRLPARPVAGFSAEDKTEILEILGDYLKRRGG